jgi:hypothetical protein
MKMRVALDYLPQCQLWQRRKKVTSLFLGSFLKRQNENPRGVDFAVTA